MEKLSALNTDLYELTMIQGYFLNNHNPRVVFDMFYRTNPFSGGYTIFTGLEELLTDLERLTFTNDDIAYLKTLKIFGDEFLNHLSSWKFTGDIYAYDEGTVAFPNEPLIRVEANLIDAQIIESFLLNKINFQTLIATKSSRMVTQTQKKAAIMEFGLRRAQGLDGALSASRASFIGGTASTSNTIAGKKYGIPVSGTMAHSWVMSFDSEEDAFRKFVELYPNNAILLIDTYDTLGSGIENAIKIGLEQKKKGLKIGVRLDSGDLSYLSREIRTRLDKAGLEDASICVSNDLTEEIIHTFALDGVPIDSFGIGTHLVTGGNQSSLNGVYKLSAREDNGTLVPTIKLSNSFEKTTNPGIKQVYRFYDEHDNALADLITLIDENVEIGKNHHFYHPVSFGDFFIMKKTAYSYVKPLLSEKMKNGKRLYEEKNVKELQASAETSLSHFHRSYKRLINPHIYKVSLSSTLKNLKVDLVQKSKPIHLEDEE